MGIIVQTSYTIKHLNGGHNEEEKSQRLLNVECNVYAEYPVAREPRICFVYVHKGIYRKRVLDGVFGVPDGVDI